MTGSSDDQRLRESIRQERETFDQHKAHQNRWFNLRLRMGYVALIMLPSIFLISVIIIFNHKTFPSLIVSSAAAALFVDVLSLIFCIWKIILNPSFLSKLAPVTTWRPSATHEIDKIRINNFKIKKLEKEFYIISALYGAEGVTNDVTDNFNSKIKAGRLALKITNEEMGGDPKPTKRKILTITYIFRGNTYTKTLSEGNFLDLP